MSTRRDQLTSVKWNHSTNAGLWLDKYIQDAASKEQDKNKLVEDVAAIRGPISEPDKRAEIYDLAYARWKNLMEAELEAGRAVIGYGKVIGRLAVGRGESVLETSVRLHHTYGVPFIPGSALKGTAANLARNHLDENWAKGEDAYNVIFGKQEEAGYVTFHDALLQPRTGRGAQNAALHQDVLTPHHPDYYQAKDDPPPPADWDSPDIIPFLSATGTYLIALTASDGCADWLAQALKILKLALSEEGIGVGAKTSSGYGRLRFIDA